jgi:hypothetical protein
MRILALLLQPAIIGLVALFLSVIWMVRDEKDKTRPMLVLALTINLFFGFLLTVYMGREGSLLPFKYDHVLFRLDESIGFSAAAIARPLQGVCRVPLIVAYQLMVPMMIVWFLVTRYKNQKGSVVLAYIAELLAGPILYAVLPACGPIYAFGAQWLHPLETQANTIRLSEMPNAFPSLHVATAFVFLLFAPGKLWRGVAFAFLICTGLATISTGEHYVIDLVSGLAFGAFAASIGWRRFRSAFLYLGLVVAWSLAVRFEYPILIAHPFLPRLLTAFTLGVAAFAVRAMWRIQRIRTVAVPVASP